MKKILLLPLLLAFAACSMKPIAKGLNCDKMVSDSTTRLEELQRVFAAYQTVNHDLASQMSQPLKEQVTELDNRIKAQKSKCWPDRKKDIDGDVVTLKDNVFKLYNGAVPMPSVVPPMMAKKKIFPPKDEDARKPASMELKEEDEGEDY